MMRPESFIRRRRPTWERVKQLVEEGRSRGVERMSEENLRELARLYPSVAVDVARARMHELDPQTQESLNRLAMAAHGLLYRRPHRRWAQGLWRFLREGYPRLFRRLGVYVLLSTAVFFVAAATAYVAVRMRPSTAYVLMPTGLDADWQEEVSRGDVGERYRQMPQVIMNAHITTNNIRVALLAFAAGVLLGLGTGYVLLLNGVMLGAFFAHFDNFGFSYETYSFLVPHGALEIFAILIAGAAGLRMGLSIACPSGLTRGAALRQGAGDAVLLVLGTVPMFVVAGAIESHITPTYWPGSVKIAVGLTALGLILVYLLAAGRRRGADEDTTPARAATASAAP